MREYIRTITKTNDLILNGTLGNDEIDRFSKADYSFIQHDSVMKLNDIRTVSINRILYHQKDGRLDINSSEYKAIEELVLNKYFPSFLHELRTSISDKEQLEAKNNEQEQQLIELETKIKELEAKVNELEHRNDVTPKS